MTTDEAREALQDIIARDGWQNVIENTIDVLLTTPGLDDDSTSRMVGKELEAMMTRHFGARQIVRARR